MEEILKDVGNRYPTNKSQVYGLLLLSLITDSFGFLFFFLSPHTPKKKTILLHCFAIKGPMFNGDCLSLNNDNGNAFLSHYVMLCHASDTTLPLFDTSVTVANMNFPRSDYNKCEYKQNVSIKHSNYNPLSVINHSSSFAPVQ